MLLKNRDSFPRRFQRKGPNFLHLLNVIFSVRMQPRSRPSKPSALPSGATSRWCGLRGNFFVILVVFIFSPLLPRRVTEKNISESRVTLLSSSSPCSHPSSYFFSSPSVYFRARWIEFNCQERKPVTCTLSLYLLSVYNQIMNKSRYIYCQS